MKQGQAPVIDEYPEVSVLYAKFLALGESGRVRAAEKSLGIHNDLVVAIDDAAERRDIEKLSSDGASYVAVCGMSRARLDHASRIVDFAQDIVRIVLRIHRDRKSHIQVQVGIDSGPAAGGVAGRTHFRYCLSGETLSIAGVLAEQCPPDHIMAGPQLYASMQKLHQFGAPILVAQPGGNVINAWPLKFADAMAAVSLGEVETEGVGHA
jgi:class 3 adenylate cyclase